MRRGKDVSDEDKVGLGFVMVSGRDEVMESKKGVRREKGGNQRYFGMRLCASRVTFS